MDILVDKKIVLYDFFSNYSDIIFIYKGNDYVPDVHLKVIKK